MSYNHPKAPPRVPILALALIALLTAFIGWQGCGDSQPKGEDRPAAEISLDAGEAPSPDQGQRDQPSPQRDAGTPDPAAPEVPAERPAPPELAKEPPPERPSSFPPLRDGMKVQVRSIVDGDTVYVYPANKSRYPYYKIRMWGYNSPECKKGSNQYGYGCIKDDEAHGKAAYDLMIKLINAKGLVLTISCPQKGQTGQLCKIDPYERGLAYLLLPDGGNVALKMLAAGYGVVYTIFYPPLLKELCEAEASAIKAKLGMWNKGREAAKQGMNSNTKSWYYHNTPSKTHDAICSKAMGTDFKAAAGE